MKEYLKKHYCKCGTKIGYNTYLYGQGRCRSCANKGKNNPRFGIHPWNYGLHTGLVPKTVFKKGQKAWNKGKKIGCTMSKEGKKILSQKAKLHQMGKNNSNWRGGTNHLPYSYNWHNISLEIRQRDNNQCQICNKYGDEVHHIDYNKQSTDSDNLITLCDSCHGKTNGNRDYWYAYFTYFRDGTHEK